jgi:hypothetical protein
MLKRQLRKTAYEYIKAQTSKYPGQMRHTDLSVVIPLEDIRSLKEGLDDPSIALVASLKQLFKDVSAPDEIDAYLVAPFRQRKVD